MKKKSPSPWGLEKKCPDQGAKNKNKNPPLSPGEIKKKKKSPLQRWWKKIHPHQVTKKKKVTPDKTSYPPWKSNDASLNLSRWQLWIYLILSLISLQMSHRTIFSIFVLFSLVDWASWWCAIPRRRDINQATITQVSSWWIPGRGGGVTRIAKWYACSSQQKNTPKI